MTKILLLVLAVAVVVAGIIQVGPDAGPAPEFELATADQIDGAEANPSVWYCPWIEATDILDSSISVATDVDAGVNITLLDPLANAEPTIFPFDLLAESATGIDTGVLLRQGESPAIVELSNGPAAAASIQWADGLIAADKCTVSVPSEWYLPGGSTKTGSFTQLRLFNPFADNATVEITVHSEFNLDLIPDIAQIDVAGRAWTTIDFGPYVPFRDELSVKVTSTTGLVIPVMVRTDEHGEATWNGSSPSQTWEFPVASPGRLEPSIAVTTAGDDDVTVSVDIVTETGIIVDAREVTLDSTAPALIPLEDLAAAPFGVRVRATAPIVATVVASVSDVSEDDGEGSIDDATASSTTLEGTDTTVASEEDFVRGLAGTTGIPELATSWIVPLETITGSNTTLWVMNSGVDLATVNVVALSEDEFLSEETIQIAPGTVLAVPVPDGIGVFGYRLTSDIPISAAWEIVGDKGVALVAGIPAG
jgi:hypothetical protein